MSARLILPKALLAAVALCGCQRAAPVGDGGGAALMRSLSRASDLEIVAEERPAQEPLARAAVRLRARASEIRFDAVVRSTSAGARVPRIVVGTSSSGLASFLARSIGVVIVPGPKHTVFRYGDRDFTERGDGIVATFADPERPELPLTLVFANDVQAAVVLAGDLMPGWKPWIRVMRGTEVVLSGPLDVDGSARPPDLARLGGARLATRKILRPIAGAPPGIAGEAARDVPAEALERYGRACVRAREIVVGWCPSGTLIPPADVRLWSRVEDYVANGDANSLSEFDPIDGSVDALLAVGAGTSTDPSSPARDVDDGGASVARAGAWKVLGPPVQPWMLDAAGVDAAWTWWGRDLDAWLAHLLRSGSAERRVRALPVADLVDAHASERFSAHILSPQRGALWRFLRETRGPTLVRELWQGTRALDDLAALDAAFEAWLRARTAAAGAQDEVERDSARERARSMSVLRGAGTCEPAADERTLARRGYGSRAFDAGVEAARAEGADALSVTAIGCDQPGLPALYDDESALRLGPRDGDVRIWAALERARSLGMRTLLSPHLLTSDGGSWSGTWTRNGAERWRAFFEHYARFVEHHGLLAELSGASVLSLGTGLASISGMDPDARRKAPGELESKRAGWARVISVARHALPGALVYSATTVKELENVVFFREVDLVGFGLAPTLDYDDAWDGRDAPLEIGVEIDVVLAALESVAVANDKRVLLTQVAFAPDLHGAARVMGARTASREWQARQFGVLSGRLQAWSGRQRLAGVFAWRWAVGDEESSIGEHHPAIATREVRAGVWGLWRGL